MHSRQHTFMSIDAARALVSQIRGMEEQKTLSNVYLQTRIAEQQQKIAEQQRVINQQAKRIADLELVVKDLAEAVEEDVPHPEIGGWT